ncbi:GIY-YIG nuclease family protein [bacterium]|nr:GIY-YIG nuclease family protein [bacterium]
MYAVYVIQHSRDRSLYVDYTNNLKTRLSQHNARENISTNRTEGTWKYVYVELYRSEKDARTREKKLKHHGTAKHKLFERIRDSCFES